MSSIDKAVHEYVLALIDVGISEDIGIKARMEFSLMPHTDEEDETIFNEIDRSLNSAINEAREKRLAYKDLIEKALIQAYIKGIEDAAS